MTSLNDIQDLYASKLAEAAVNENAAARRAGYIRHTGRPWSADPDRFTQYRDRAGAIAGGFAAEAKRNVVFHSGLFNALEWLNDLTQIVVMAPDNTPDPAGELVAEIFAAGIPSRIVIYGSADKALPAACMNRPLASLATKNRTLGSMTRQLGHGSR